MKTLKLLLIFMFVFMAQPVFCEMLSIENYTNMVIENNSEFKSVQLKIDSLKKELPQIEKSPLLFKTNVGYRFCNKLINNAPIELEIEEYSGSKSGIIDGYNGMMIANASLNKTFAMLGIDVSLGVRYAPCWKSCDGKTRSLFRIPTLMDISSNGNVKNENSETILIGPFLNCQMSLWKNIFGRYAKVVLAKREAELRSALYLLKYEKENIIFNAKAAYWNLAYFRKVVNFKKLSLDRAKKILDLNQKRHKMNLSGKSDLLQAQAAVRLKELDLNRAHREEKKAEKIFNQFLNVGDKDVEYELEEFENKWNSFKDNPIPEKRSLRADVLSSFEKTQVALCDKIISKRDLGADLVLNGDASVDLFNRFIDINMYSDVNSGTETFRSSASLDNGRYSIGLSHLVNLEYKLPLDFNFKRNMDEVRNLAKLSAQKSAESAVAKENDDWLQLLSDWDNAKTGLKLAFEIKKIQEQRYKEEQSMLENGKNTTYFVLQSQQTLDDAELIILENILELIKIYEKAEIFYDGNVEF